MFYGKCNECRFVCRCCSSRFDAAPMCSGCEQKHDEFSPAVHIKYCPLDTTPVKRPRYSVNGTVMREE